MHNHHLSALQLRGTSQILVPELLFLSPAVGLLTHLTSGASSSSLVTNLRSCYTPLTRATDKNHSIVPAVEIAKEFYHQRVDGEHRRYGPTALSRSRSKASYWLQPSSLGCIVGMALSSESIEGCLSDDAIDRELLRHGIECNAVNGEYSGVSLARYRRIVRLIADDLGHIDSTSGSKTNPFSRIVRGYSLPIILSVLWEKSSNKQSLLDFILAAELSMGRSMLRSQYSELRLPGSTAHQQWLQLEFTRDDLLLEQIHTATDVLLGGDVNTKCGDSSLDRCSSAAAWAPHDDVAVPAALERVACSVALEHLFKRPIRLGRYQYRGDGSARPDCVEVVVREVVDALIYDPRTGKLNKSWLPDTAISSVRQFYSKLEAGEVSDTPQRPDSSAKESVLRATGSSKQYWEHTSAGQHWFDLCSNLSSCEYLSETSSSSSQQQQQLQRLPYELRPSMRNVVRALREILIGGEQPHFPDATDHSRVHASASSSSTWNHLKDLCEFWNGHLITSSIALGPIRTEEKLLKFRAPHSDTETICREVGCVHFASGNVLELELEASHQLATVRYHLPDSHRLWLPLHSNELYGKYSTRWIRMNETPRKEAVTTAEAHLLPLLSIVLGDNCLVSIADGNNRSSSISTLSFQQATRPLMHALLSTCWGEGRRYRLYRAGSGSNIVSATDAVLTNDDARLSLEQSARIAKDALRLIAANYTQYGMDRSGVTAEGKESTLVTIQLFCWVLQAGCIDMPAEDIAGQLIDTLPTSFLYELATHPAVLEVVKRRPDGELLQRLLLLSLDHYSFFSASRVRVHSATDPTTLSRHARPSTMSDEPLRWTHMARLLLFVSKRFLTRSMSSLYHY